MARVDWKEQDIIEVIRPHPLVPSEGFVSISAEKLRAAVAEIEELRNLLRDSNNGK